MKKMLIAAIGTCVHAAGMYNFAQLARKEGYQVTYLGSANPVEQVIDAAVELQPEAIALGYRLSQESAQELLSAFFEGADKQGLGDLRYFFGGTLETSAVAETFNRFEGIFDGSQSQEEILLALRRQKKADRSEQPPQTLRERLDYKAPFPLIRHHIGLGTLEETIREIEILADSGLLDVISLAPDQNAQQYFFQPEKMDPLSNGAGGAPIRNREDFLRLYQASRRGNYPLMRCYSGTQDLKPFCALLQETIHNAWAAVPLTWYSELDRRSDRPLLEAIRENQETIAWNARQGIPVEINESHQWALRYCNDAVEVATAYLSAYQAKALGVGDYVMQLMLNTPPSISPKMDLAKMLAKIKLIQPLEDGHFKVIRMIRTGLLAYPSDPDVAKGLLAASMFFGAYLKPDIVHAVSYTEAIRRATSKEIVETVKIVKKALSLAEMGTPDYLADPQVAERVEALVEEAQLIINAIAGLDRAKANPLADAEVLYQAVKTGLLDAPGLQGFSVAQGRFPTEIWEGCHVSVDGQGRPLDEKGRLRLLGFA